MAQYFKFEVDKRFLPLLLPCGLRPTRDGVTLTDTSFVAKLGLFKLETPLDEHRRCTRHPRLPVVDRNRPSALVRRRRAHPWYQQQGGSMRALPREGAVVAEAKRALRAHRHGPRPRRSDRCPSPLSTGTRPRDSQMRFRSQSAAEEHLVEVTKNLRPRVQRVASRPPRRRSHDASVERASRMVRRFQLDPEQRLGTVGAALAGDPRLLDQAGRARSAVKRP